MNRQSFRWIVLAILSMCIAVGVACAATPPSLSGQWVMLQVYPSIALVPMVGPSTQTNYVVLQCDVEQDDLSLAISNRYCFSIVEDTSPLSDTEIPDAFMQSLHPAPCNATLQEEEGEFAFHQEKQIEIRGAVLENPETDELPTDPDDPRVIDQDEDGFPGLTVNINLLGLSDEQIYVVQRFQYELDGRVVSPDRIEGLIRWTDEQEILAATNQMLLAGAESEPDPDPSKHVFVMLRAQEDWSCEWLREHWREVFGMVEDGN